MPVQLLLRAGLLLLLGCVMAVAQTPVGTNSVSQDGNVWHIRGERREVQLDAESLAIKMSVGTAPTNRWQLAGSEMGDLTVRAGEARVRLQLNKAGRKQVSPYQTGYSHGLKVELGDFKSGDTNLDLQVQLLLTLDGQAEDLLCEIIATDRASSIAELRWPGAVEPDSFDHTVVPFMQGMLLPKNWPKKAWLYDQMSYGRGLYMPWFGWLQGEAALLAILETADDGGCRFEHPANGPTQLGPRWEHSLGRWAYPRRVRFCALEQGGYVELAKRYRRYVIGTGQFVSLAEKIARNRRVADMIGTPVIHTSILYHMQPESSYYSKDDPSKNHQLVTFAARAAEIEKVAAQGIERAYVHLDGWGARGYDNLHPDAIPAGAEAGGWEGMRQFADVCDRLGFPFAIHDQYRDFYLDAPSYDPRHTILDEYGKRPSGSTWPGGKQSILCSRLAPGYVRRNHQAILDHGVKLRGAYLDVFSVVPPDECYAAEHAATRTECLRYRGECLDSVRAWGGIVSSEEPSGWSIPHLDLVHHGPYALNPNPGKGPAMGIPVPLFNLVYHEALLIPWSLSRGAWGIPEKDLGYLHALGNAGLPYLSLSPGAEELQQVRTLCALHRRVGQIEMTRHQFLDAQYRRQAFTYADGTRVQIDLDKDTFEINPPLSANH